MDDAGAGGAQPAASQDPVHRAWLGEIHGCSLHFLAPPTVYPRALPQQPVM